VVELLDRYHFNELVEIADLSAEIAWLSLQGPAAPAAAETACGTGCAPERPGFRSLSFGERTLRVVRCDEVGVPGIHFLIRRHEAPALREVLELAAAEAGGGPAGLEAWTVCRVEAGVPWQGAELDETVLPMEARLHYLLDLGKGCYIGQEVVTRAVMQGRTNWSLWRLRLPPASAISPGAELVGSQRQRPVVRVRSVVRPPGASGALALAFVHRDVARPGPLVVRSGQRELEIVLEDPTARAEPAPGEPEPGLVGGRR
jgi:folate-binding protein YgfZ